MSTNNLTLMNEIPPDFGPVMFTIVDSASPPMTEELAVPYNGKVVHPVNPANAPWTINTMLLGPAGTTYSVSSAPYVCSAANTTLTCVLGVASQTGSSFAPTSVTPGTDGFLPNAANSQPDAAQGWRKLCNTAADDVDDPPAAKTLAFNMQAQAQTYWCWAAVTSSVANYYAVVNAPSQCQLATWAIANSVDCCVPKNASSAPCNATFDTPQALAHVGCLNAPVLVGGLVIKSIMTEIAAGRPIGVRIAWAGAQVTHAIAMTGYDCTDSSNATVTLQDPTLGTSVLPFASFPSNYHGASNWAATFLTQAPAIV